MMYKMSLPLNFDIHRTTMIFLDPETWISILDLSNLNIMKKIVLTLHPFIL